MPIWIGGGTVTISAHAATHENAGADEINVVDLSGELADLQKVKDHTHQSAGSGVGGKIDHGLALNGLADDDHTQYALLAGRIGGQTIIGDTSQSGVLTLQSTAHLIKGKISFGSSAYDEINNRLGIGNTNPALELDVSGTTITRSGLIIAGSITAVQADITIITHQVGSTRFKAYGPNASTMGGFLFTQLSSDESSAATNLEITVGGDIVLAGGGGKVGIGLTPTANMGGLSIEAWIITLKETTTPTADTNYGKIYTKTDNKLYFQDGAGTEHEIAFV